MSGALLQLADVDWDDWRPVDVATLVFMIQGDALLLIRKKRGLGAGKINGPGGRLEPGESLLECAVREVQEELGVIPLAPRPCGENRFQFADGYSIHVHVFRADGWDGEPVETDEAIPHPVSLSAVPYSEMWEDDPLWVPLVLEERPFVGRYLFRDDRMLGHSIELPPGATPPASSLPPAPPRNRRKSGAQG